MASQMYGWAVKPGAARLSAGATPCWLACVRHVLLQKDVGMIRES